MAEGRDLPGRPVSLWLTTTPQTDYPTLDTNITVDVAVLGGGITGIAAAYMLKQAGATVAVLEAGRVVESVTGNTTAKITSLHSLVYDHFVSQFGEEKARLYADAQEAAKEKIASLVQELSIDCDFLRENLDVAKEFMGDRASVPELDDLAKIPNGYGEVVEWKGERVALYKDDNGNAHACSAVCTHMGCLVRWNSAERSWDCPCHGSRFRYDGKVVQGPANKDLEPKEI